MLDAAPPTFKPPTLEHRCHQDPCPTDRNKLRDLSRSRDGSTAELVYEHLKSTCEPAPLSGRTARRGWVFLPGLAGVQVGRRHRMTLETRWSAEGSCGAHL